MTALLAGISIVEMAAIGPVPFCAMLLGDLGAEITMIERAGPQELPFSLPPDRDPVARLRTRIALDLKSPAGLGDLLDRIEAADVLLEGFRPGVAERLGFGPEIAHRRNPRLIYGRMTGFGQAGPRAAYAGHDLTYIALTGALHAIGRAGERPVPPLNLIGDYAGGAMLLAVGVLAALVARGTTGQGKVVDAAMVDGAALMMTPFYGWLAAGLHRDERGANFLDGGCPFYDTYECADRKFVAVAALEPKFFASLARGLDLDARFVAGQTDRRLWPELRAVLAARFLTRTRDEWDALFRDTDACLAPVLSMAEAPLHPHNIARKTFVTENGITRPAAAPRFS
jgi:alpha-methylacyl-CoA racemase